MGMLRVFEKHNKKQIPRLDVFVFQSDAPMGWLNPWGKPMGHSVTRLLIVLAV
jgi:hypothetical protein